MFKNNFIIVLCFVSNILFSQNPYQNDLFEVYDTITKATSRQDWNKVLDHTYTKLFDIASREQLIEVMANTFSDTSVMKISVLSGRADSVSRDSMLVGNELFVILYDSKEMQFTLTQVLAEPEKDHTSFIKLLISFMESSYGKENVRYNAEKATLDIIRKKGINICSNTSPMREKNRWTLMEVKNDNPQLLKMLLPEQVLEWIKAH